MPPDLTDQDGVPRPAATHRWIIETVRRMELDFRPTPEQRAILLTDTRTDLVWRELRRAVALDLGQRGRHLQHCQMFLPTQHPPAITQPWPSKVGSCGRIFGATSRKRGDFVMVVIGMLYSSRSTATSRSCHSRSASARQAAGHKKRRTPSPPCRPAVVRCHHPPAPVAAAGRRRTDTAGAGSATPSSPLTFSKRPRVNTTARSYSRRIFKVALIRTVVEGEASCSSQLCMSYSHSSWSRHSYGPLA